MNLELPEQCLLCLESIVTKPRGENSGIKSENQVEFSSSFDGSTVRNFEQLCEYLKVEFPLSSLKFKNVSRLLGDGGGGGRVDKRENCCGSLLCGKCLELANGLSLMYSDLRRVQRRIDYGIRTIQDVIRRSDGAVDNHDDKSEQGQQEVGSSNKVELNGGNGGTSTDDANGSNPGGGGSDQQASKKRKIERIGGGVASSSIVKDYLEFVDTFRTLVKKVETHEPEPVVLSEEAESLAKIYQQLEDESEEQKEENMDELSSSALVIDEQDNGSSPGGAESSVINEDSLMEDGQDDEESRDDDTVFNILSNVDVSIQDSGEDSLGDSGEFGIPMEDSNFENDGPPISLNIDPLGSVSVNPITWDSKLRRTNFACRYCNLVFDSPTVYYAHRKAQHPAESRALVIPSFHGSTIAANRTGECPICGDNKNTRSNRNSLLQLLEHMLSHELAVPLVTTVPADSLSPPEKDKRYICDYDYCDQRFLLEMNLDLHKICYHESNLIQLKCQSCGDATSKTWEDLVNHLVEEHGSDTIYSCKSCPMAFITADKMLEHMETHKLSRKLPCSECSSVSPSLKDLYQHFNEAHPNLLTPLQCNICYENFLMPGTFRSHITKFHPNTAPTVFTARSFSISPVHSEGHTQQAVKCPHCPDVRVFKNKTTLDNHIRIHHDTTVDKHKCDQCGKAFVHRSTLRYHIQQVHLGIRYPCPQPNCTKSFTAKSLLKGHLKLHNGEGPAILTCPVCGKIVTSMTALKAHMTTQHGDNEPVSCEICGREFLNMYSLRGHKSEIHNLKPFPCPHCPSTFSWLRKFQQHMKTAHPNVLQETERANEAVMLPSYQIVTMSSINFLNK